jgi:hypothetical protein
VPIELLLSLLLSVPQSKAPSPEIAYRLAVETHQNCDDGSLEAVAGLGARELKEVASAVSRGAKTGTWPEALVASAVTMHIRLAIWMRQTGQEKARWLAHLNTGAQLALLVDARDSRMAFLSAWLLVTASQYLAAGELGALRELLEHPPRTLRAHPSLILARGSMHELLASEQAGPATHVLFSGPPTGFYMRAVDWLRARQGEHRRTAVGLYSRINADDTVGTEAKVRLALLLADTDRLEEARAAISATRIRTLLPTTLEYYRLLVSARIHERSRRFADAERDYRAAATLFPQAQTPSVGRMHLLLLQGDLVGAGTVASELIGRLGPAQRVEDPWSGYLAGQNWRTPELILSMLSEVRLCGP